MKYYWHNNTATVVTITVPDGYYSLNELLTTITALFNVSELNAFTLVQSGYKV